MASCKLIDQLKQWTESHSGTTYRRTEERHNIRLGKQVHRVDPPLQKSHEVPRRGRHREKRMDAALAFIPPYSAELSVLRLSMRQVQGLEVHVECVSVIARAKRYAVHQRVRMSTLDSLGRQRKDLRASAVGNNLSYG